MNQVNQKMSLLDLNEETKIVVRTEPPDSEAEQIIQPESTNDQIELDNDANSDDQQPTFGRKKVNDLESDSGDDDSDEDGLDLATISKVSLEQRKSQLEK